MRIGVHSDFHFENHADHGDAILNEIKDVDVLVIAGDFENDGGLIDAFGHACAKFKHVVYVIGNHEVWESSFSKIRAVLARASKMYPNLHVLDNQVAVINGVRFLGATMFFPNQPDNVLFEKYMVDFQLAENYREEVYIENERAQQFLYANAMPGDIIVTHHLPCHKSIHPMYERDALNRFFLCDMEHLISSQRPAAWIHGHTHFSFDYIFDETRIVCNPFGYVFACNKQWNASKIIEAGSTDGTNT